MEIIEVPFIEKVGIGKNQGGHLALGFDESVKSHIGTIHSGALFTLAEAASAQALQTRFPELAGKVIPVIRDAQIKYKQPANTTINAYPSLSDEAIARFERQFVEKRRSTIAVDVEVKDCDDRLVCVGRFNWFIRSVE